MTITELLEGLNPGDRIEYVRGLSRGRTSTESGVIIQITNKLITVDLGKYRDTLDICDIENGKVLLIANGEPIQIEKSDRIPPREAQSGPDPDRTIQENPNQVTTPTNNQVDRNDPKAHLKLTSAQIKELWDESGHSINLLSKALGISWPTVKSLLKKHGLYEPIGRPKKKEVAASIALIGTSEPLSIDPPPALQPDITTSQPFKLPMKHGKINWNIMWHIVKTELDKGREKYDIADEFGISHKAMSAKCEGMGYTKKVKPEPHEFEHLKDKSRDELIAIAASLRKQGEFIDVIISCIDQTLGQVSAGDDL